MKALAISLIRLPLTQEPIMPYPKHSWNVTSLLPDYAGASIASFGHSPFNEASPAKPLDLQHLIALRAEAQPPSAPRWQPETAASASLSNPHSYVRHKPTLSPLLHAKPGELARNERLEGKADGAMEITASIGAGQAGTPNPPSRPREGWGCPPPSEPFISGCNLQKRARRVHFASPHNSKHRGSEWRTSEPKSPGLSLRLPARTT